MTLYNTSHLEPKRTGFDDDPQHYGSPPNTQPHRGDPPAHHGNPAHVTTPDAAKDSMSSVSLSIDTIMDAAEAIKIRNARVHAYHGPPSKIKFGKKPRPVKPPQTQEHKELAHKIRQHLNCQQTNRALILAMALEERPRCRPRKRPAISTLIRPKFYWNEFPQLEAVLFDKMPQFYANQFQSKQQHAYNIELVKRIKVEAKNSGYSFEANLDDKRLRDRIRCFYKTRIQNAKKRLQSLKSNINDSPKHLKILAALLTKASGGEVMATVEKRQM